MRYAYSLARTQSRRYIQQHLYRYWWWAIYWRRFEYLLFSPDQYENHDEELQRTEPHPDWRVRWRYGTANWRRYCRSRPETFQPERNIRSHHHPLPESETFCRRSWRSSERSHALRPPSHASTFPATNRKSRKFVCRRNRTKNRIAGRCHCRCFGNRRKWIYQCRQIPSGHRARQALLGRKTSNYPSTGKAHGRNHCPLPNGNGRVAEITERDHPASKRRSGTDASGIQCTHWKHNTHNQGSTSWKGKDTPGTSGTDRLPYFFRCAGF